MRRAGPRLRHVIGRPHVQRDEEHEESAENVHVEEVGLAAQGARGGEEGVSGSCSVETQREMAQFAAEQRDRIAVASLGAMRQHLRTKDFCQ